MNPERLHDTHGNIKVTCPHGCGRLIVPGRHDWPGSCRSDAEPKVPAHDLMLHAHSHDGPQDEPHEHLHTGPGHMGIEHTHLHRHAPVEYTERDRRDAERDRARALDAIERQRAGMEVRISADDLMDRGAWERACDMLGINPWAVKEGLMDSGRRLTLTLEQARTLGLLEGGQ